MVFDRAKLLWRIVAPRLAAERWLLCLSVLIAVLAAVAGIHPMSVLPFWVMLAAVILSRGAPPVRAAPADIGVDVETKFDPLAPLLDALDMPVLVVAADETVVFQNAAAEKAFGTIPQNSYLSARVRSPGILDMVRETIATGKVNQIEHAERLPSEAVYVVRVAPVDIGSDVSGRRIFVLTYRDISQARRIDRMRSDFVANASHELRTPLASLRGFIETLQGPAREDRKAQEKFFGIMHEQVTRMSSARGRPPVTVEARVEVAHRPRRHRRSGAAARTCARQSGAACRRTGCDDRAGGPEYACFRPGGP